MKKYLGLVGVLVSIISSSVLAGASVQVVRSYDCGSSQIALLKEGKKYSVRMSYRAERNVVNIVSGAHTVAQLQDMFKGGDLSVDDEARSESGLPAGSLAFSGFHYRGGEMYVAAEDDTNEDGYIFSVEKGLIDGADEIQAASIFWHDRSDSEVSHLTCKLNR